MLEILIVAGQEKPHMCFWPLNMHFAKIRSCYIRGFALNMFRGQRHIGGFGQEKPHMWCDQAKSVWSRSNSVFIFLPYCMHHFQSYILQKTPLKLVNWFQRYEKLKDAKNNRKQHTFSALFASILKSIFPTSDWFCLITSHMCFWPLNMHFAKIRSCYIKGLP